MSAASSSLTNDGRPATDWRLPLRRRSATRSTSRSVSASYCHCTRCQRRSGTAASAQARLAPGALRIVQAQSSSGSGCRPTTGGRRLLLGLRRRALEPQPGRGRPLQRAPRHVRLRSRHPAAVPAVRGLRGPVGADPRRRPALDTRSGRPPDAARADKTKKAGRSTTSLRERVAELERERQLLNAIANYAPSLICLVDDDGARAAVCVEPGVRADARLRARTRQAVSSSGSGTSPTASARLPATASSPRSVASHARSTKGAGCSVTGRRSTSRGRARRCRRSRAARCI